MRTSVIPDTHLAPNQENKYRNCSVIPRRKQESRRWNYHPWERNRLNSLRYYPTQFDKFLHVVQLYVHYPSWYGIVAICQLNRRFIYVPLGFCACIPKERYGIGDHTYVYWSVMNFIRDHCTRPKTSLVKTTRNVFHRLRNHNWCKNETAPKN